MGIISFKEVQPVLPSQDVSKSIEYYVDKLGFKLVFQDDAQDPKYAGVRRENIEMHFQWHEASDWESIERPMLRFVIQGIDNLYNEYEPLGVFHKNTKLEITPWGTKEFEFYDLYMNGLAFYEDK